MIYEKKFTNYLNEKKYFQILFCNQLKTDWVTLPASDSGTSKYQGCVNALSNIPLMS